MGSTISFARGCGTISQNCRRRNAAKVLPYILKWAEAGAKLSGVDVISGFNADHGDPRGGGKAVLRARLCDFAGAPVRELPGGVRLARPTIPRSRSSTSPIPCRGICPKIPRSRSTAAYDAKGFPIGVQIVGRRFDDLGVLGMAKAFEGLRGPQKPWPVAAEANKHFRHGRACPGHPRLIRATHAAVRARRFPAPMHVVSRNTDDRKETTHGV